MNRYGHQGGRKVSLTALLAAAAVLVWCGVGRADDKPADMGALMGKGDFQAPELATAIGKLFQFKLTGKTVTLNRDAWEDSDNKADEDNNGNGQVQIQGGGVQGGARIQVRVAGMGMMGNNATGIDKVFQEIESAAGSNSARSSMGGDSHSSSFSGGKITGRLEVRGEAISVSLREEAAPNRTLELSDDGAGAWRILATDPSGDLVLLNQTPKGAVSVAAVLGGKPVAASGASYLDFYRQNRDLADGRILPVLRHLGADLKVSRQTPAVRAAARSRLTPLSEADTQHAAQLLKDLDNDSFEVREKATKELNDNYDRFQSLIEAKAKAPGLTPEVTDRLRKTAAAHPDAGAANQVIDALNLLDDPGFLAELFEGASDAQKAALAARLERLTGQKLGTDAAAWQNWLAAHPAKTN
jgi:hypothetical protein